MSERFILLNPGPVTLSPGVRTALTRGDWCHREQEFAALTQSINERLVDVYDADGSDYASVLITGSGTCAVESMLATLAPRESKTLVVANGVYGERMAMMLDQMQRPFELLKADWSAPIDFDAVERHLRDDDGITHVASVQHETTTGRLNDIARLGALCTKYERALLLDSVSAFGAEDIRFAEWNVEALAATANKCLHGVPGISFVIARRSGLSRQDLRAGSVYLDLKRYYSTQHGDGFSPFTLAVQCVFGLDVALEEFGSAGGWRARQARYRQIATRIASRLEGLGVEPMLPEADRSSTMYSYWLPAGANYQQFHDALKARGFIVYAGQGNLSGRLFRIAHMGAILDSDVDLLVQLLSEALSS